MKSQQQHVSEDDPQTILALNSRAPKSVNGGENSDAIPVDLIFEILLKLPTKSIARCRCVSKLWSSILLRTDFMELFLTRSTTPPQLLFSCPNNDDLFLFTAPQVQNTDQNSCLVSRSYHTKPPFDCSPRVCGYVGGLVCLTYLRDLEGGQEMVPMICKPSTGRQAALPLPALKTTGFHVISFFVYEPIGKQFKVLSMIWPRYGNIWNCKECQILTLGTQTLSWRKIDCCIPHHPIHRGICIDGCLYYQAMVDGHRSWISTIVICFDVRSETFRFVKKDIAISTLVNYEGRLGALQSDRADIERVSSQTRSLELWVLVDAEKNEWSKKNVYALPPLWKNIVPKGELCFVGLTSTNDIVLSERYPSTIFCLFYYNLERHTIIKVEIQGMDVYNHHRVQTYLDHAEDVKLLQL